MSDPASPALQGGTFVRLIGILGLCTVVAVYVSSRLHGHWPPSHPWSGITLTLFGIVNLRPQRGRMALPLAVLMLCSGMLWAWSAHMANRQSAPSRPAHSAERGLASHARVI